MGVSLIFSYGLKQRSKAAGWRLRSRSWHDARWHGCPLLERHAAVAVRPGFCVELEQQPPDDGDGQKCLSGDRLMVSVRRQKISPAGQTAGAAWGAAADQFGP